jgi:hypothetical protein
MIKPTGTQEITPYNRGTRTKIVGDARIQSFKTKKAPDNAGAFECLLG